MNKQWSMKKWEKAAVVLVLSAAVCILVNAISPVVWVIATLGGFITGLAVSQEG